MVISFRVPLIALIILLLLFMFRTNKSINYRPTEGFHNCTQKANPKEFQYRPRIGSLYSQLHAISDMSKRRFGVEQVTLTSHNPQLRNADFSNPIEAQGDSMILLNEQGTPGCITYIWISMYHMNDSITVLADNLTVFTYYFNSSQPHPMGPPFSTKEKNSWCTSLPICYSESAKIIVKLSQFQNISMNKLRRCVERDITCSIVRYHEVQFSRLPGLSRDAAICQAQDTMEAYSQTNKWLRQYAFGRKSDYKLLSAMDILPLDPDFQAFNLTKGPGVTLLDLQSSGVVSTFSIQLHYLGCELNRTRKINQVVTPMGVFLSCIWFRATFDDKVHIEMPIANLFGMFTGLTKVYSSALDVMRRGNSTYSDVWIGTFRMPMPFWKNAKFELYFAENSYEDWVSNLFKYTLIENNAPPTRQAYFHATSHYISEWSYKDEDWGCFLNHSGGWGHIAGVQVGYYGNVLYGMLPEANLYFWRDEMLSPFYKGTGLEDFFGYVHGWIDAKHRSYLNSGFTSTRSGRLHTYRIFMSSPMPFHSSVKGYLEAYIDPCDSLDIVTYFYSSRQPSTKLLLTVQGNELCNHWHTIAASSISTEVISYPFKATKALGQRTKKPKSFTCVYKRMKGNNRDPHNETVVDCCQLNKGDSINVNVNVPKDCPYGLVLRRTFDYSYPEQKAKVYAEGIEVGNWYDASSNRFYKIEQSELTLYYSVPGKTSLTFISQSEFWSICTLDIFCLT